MKTHKILLLAIAFMMAIPATAQTENETKASVVNWGLKMQANASNIVLHHVYEDLHSNMNLGGELGAFIDFNISEHFLIQFNWIGFAEHTNLVNNWASRFLFMPWLDSVAKRRVISILEEDRSPSSHCMASWTATAAR